MSIGESENCLLINDLKYKIYIEMWCVSVVCTESVDSVCTNRIGWGLSAQNSVTNTNRHHSHTIYLTHDLRSAHHLTIGETVRLLLQWILSNIFPFGFAFFLCFVYCCWRFFFLHDHALTLICEYILNKWCGRIYNLYFTSI